MTKDKPMITKEMRKQLNASFPPEAISAHPTKSFLSTLKAIYVVERLNDVFGVGRWDLKTKVVKETENYVLVKGKLVIFDYRVNVPVQYGGHNIGGKNSELADSYKSAVTDCLSKSASYLEIGIDVFKGKVTHKNAVKQNPVVASVAKKAPNHLLQLKQELNKRGAKTENEAVVLYNKITGENIKSLKLTQAVAQKYLAILLSSPMGK